MKPIQWKDKLMQRKIKNIAWSIIYIWIILSLVEERSSPTNLEETYGQMETSPKFLVTPLGIFPTIQRVTKDLMKSAKTNAKCLWVKKKKKKKSIISGEAQTFRKKLLNYKINLIYTYVSTFIWISYVASSTIMKFLSKLIIWEVNVLSK